MTIQWAVTVNHQMTMLVNAPISTDAINKAAKEWKAKIGDDQPIHNVAARRIQIVLE